MSIDPKRAWLVCGVSGVLLHTEYLLDLTSITDIYRPIALVSRHILAKLQWLISQSKISLVSVPIAQTTHNAYLLVGSTELQPDG